MNSEGWDACIHRLQLVLQKRPALYMDNRYLSCKHALSLFFPKLT